MRLLFKQKEDFCQGVLCFSFVGSCIYEVVADHMLLLTQHNYHSSLRYLYLPLLASICS